MYMINTVNEEIWDDGVPKSGSSRLLVDVQGEAHGIHDCVWNEAYSVGVSQIDRQHQVMRTIIDELHLIDDDSKKIDEFLARLFNYSMIHLRQEELFLRRINYPDLDVHLAWHGVFTDQFNHIDMMFTSNHRSLDKNRLMVFLLKWWNNHILITDMKYAEYLRENNIDGSNLFKLSQEGL